MPNTPIFDDDLEQALALGADFGHTMLIQIFRNLSQVQTTMSTGLDQLTQADADLKTAFGQVITQLDAAVQQLSAAVQANNPTQIAAITADLQGMTAQAKAALARDTLPDSGGTSTTVAASGGNDTPPAGGGTTAAPAAGAT